MRAKSKPFASDFAYFSSCRSTDTKAGEPPLLAVLRLYGGEEKVSNAAHNVVSQEMCTRSAGVVQHPDALTQLHTGAVHAAVRCLPSPSALF